MSCTNYTLCHALGERTVQMITPTTSNSNVAFRPMSSTGGGAAAVYHVSDRNAQPYPAVCQYRRLLHIAIYIANHLTLLSALPLIPPTVSPLPVSTEPFVSTTPSNVRWQFVFQWGVVRE
jgi:hypothetical protein